MPPRRGNTILIVTTLWDGRPSNFGWITGRGQRTFSSPKRTGRHLGPPIFQLDGYFGRFPRKNCDCCVKLTAYFHLVPSMIQCSLQPLPPTLLQLAHGQLYHYCFISSHYIPCKLTISIHFWETKYYAGNHVPQAVPVSKASLLFACCTTH